MRTEQEIREKLKELVKNYYWTKRDGSKIKLKNMKRSHLLNSINLTERTNSKELNRLLRCELAIREEKFNEFYKNDNLEDLIQRTFYIESFNEPIKFVLDEIEE